MMESARYGRMSMGPCLTRKYGEEGCVADVIDYVDTVCSGRSHCKLDVPDIAMQGIRPCSEQLASFLQVSYHCVKGATSSLLLHISIWQRDLHANIIHILLYPFHNT